MNALDVEGAQRLVDQFFEFGGERRLLDLVLALKQIDRVGACREDLLSDRRRRADQNASRMALTIVRANSELMRSSAFTSC
jgi:hypothetical protein